MYINGHLQCCTSSIHTFLSFLIELPYNDYFEYFGPDFKLHISPTNMSNQNNLDYLNKIKARLFENLRLVPHAPSVQMQREYNYVYEHGWRTYTSSCEGFKLHISHNCCSIQVACNTHKLHLKFSCFHTKM